MAGAPPRYSEKQWQAIFHARFELGLSIAETHRRANAGTLRGVDAFPVSYDQVRDRVRSEARELRLKTPPAIGDYDTISRRLWALHLREVDRLERELKRRNRDVKRDPELRAELAATIKRHREARALLAPTKGTGPVSGEEEEPTPRPMSFAEQLAQDGTEPTDPTPPPSSRDVGQEDVQSDGSDEASGDDANEEGEDVEIEGGVRSSVRAIGARAEPELQTASVDGAAFHQ